MPRTAIVETATGAILVLDPPTREVPVLEEQTVLVQVGSRIETILPEELPELPAEDPAPDEDAPAPAPLPLPTREVPVLEEQTVLVQVGSRIETILPEGVECEVVELSDAESAKLDAPNSRFYCVDGKVVAEAVPEDPAEVARIAQRARDVAAVRARAKDDEAFASLARLMELPSTP